MVATRPEPTVLPPSRFVGYKILLLLGVFQALFYLYYSKYALLFEVLKFFRTIVEPRMYKLMFIHPLVNLAEKYLMLAQFSNYFNLSIYSNSLAYLDTLRDNISQAILNKELNFVSSCWVDEASRTVKVGITEMKEEYIQRLKEFENMGPALDIFQQDLPVDE